METAEITLFAHVSAINAKISAMNADNQVSIQLGRDIRYHADEFFALADQIENHISEYRNAIFK